MSRLLDLMARGVERAPVFMVAAIAALSVLFAVFGAQQEVDTDITGFAAEGELTQTFDRVEDEFGARGGSIQVIVDAGPGGNVLAADGIRAADRIAEIAEGAPAVADRLREETERSPAIASFAAPVLAQTEQFELDLESLTDRFAVALAGGVDEEALTPLLSDDAVIDGEESRARGGLVVVQLEAGLSEEAERQAGIALQQELAATDFGWFEVEPFSFAILSEDIEEGLLDDLPLLLGASFVLIILILSLLYRKASDVILGVVGLILTILWMNGLAVLLGPQYLGLTGPFNQIAVAVPVLLVGLGIDYSVHLNARYREERARGAASAGSASTAVRTVGVALLLATITTIIGFLANLATPLPPIADFGVFAAVGIASAFVVMGLLVPSARNLLDRRAVHPRGGGTDGSMGGGVAGRLAFFPARIPGVVLVVAAAAGVAGGIAAADLDTSFSQDEFIPQDSQAAILLERMDTLFGGDVSEQTFVVVDADLRDPEVLNAMLDVEEAIADLDDVVEERGRADVRSPAALVAQLEQSADDLREQLSAQFSLLADPEASADDLPFPGTLDVDDLPPDLLDEAAEDGSGDLAGFGAGDLEGMEDRLPEGVSPEEALLRSLSGDRLADELRQSFLEQLADDGPEGMTDEDLRLLADLEPAEIDRDALEAVGYPTDDLPEGTLGLLDTVERLRALGWDGERFAPDADVEAVYDAVRQETGGDLDLVLSETSGAALMIVGTQAGEDRAEQLASELDAALSTIRDRGASTSIASEQLLINQTLDELTDAQIGAIMISLGAATVLLVTYYGVKARRPLLGLITMVPSLLAVPLILGSMRVVGLSFNALTATVASIAIGIGVPYGIHITNRYLEQREREADAGATVQETIVHTGAALVGSAVTTASGFGVLVLSGLEPIRQFGGVTSVTIIYALIAAIFAEASCLVLWDRYHRRRETGRTSRSERQAVREPVL